MKMIAKLIIAFCLFSCASSTARNLAIAGDDKFPAISALTGTVQLIQTPNPAGHPEFLAAINEARNSIQMTMFHITDPKIVQALITAQSRGVDVQVIVDGASLSQKKLKKPFDQLKSATPPVQVRASSPAFKITHEKAMIVDGSKAFITAINLTNAASNTRDFGVILTDQSVIQEMTSVFQADWKNAESQTGNTPALKQPNLVWSPVDSEEKLSGLVASATQTIVATVENLGDPKMMSAFEAAVTRGVNVRLIVPMCDQNVNPLYWMGNAFTSARSTRSRLSPIPF